MYHVELMIIHIFIVTQAVRKGDSQVLNPAKNINLPASYGENNLMLMVQSPSVIFLYWDLSPGQISALNGYGPLLARLYDCGGAAICSGNLIEEAALPPCTNNWYFNKVRSGFRYYAELGYRNGENEFIYIMRSNEVQTPGNQAAETYGMGHAVMMPVIQVQKKAVTQAGEQSNVELPEPFAGTVSSMSFYMGIHS